jgi:hypothetical protein
MSAENEIRMNLFKEHDALLDVHIYNELEAFLQLGGKPEVTKLKIVNSRTQFNSWRRLIEDMDR